ncbi:hypothetical protein F4821DRAFT_257166 [Hypoxylon rubiginosum]|uniref:Uncharacterized protein n=1 Tax=Hypoxylon rubiginosum TaxID=110542 RepID=A0ACC0D9E2_9PEZI|nr:hypothetical protein F4821DRAFT_257166 [Hypoxylon rubiginosum]
MSAFEKKQSTAYKQPTVTSAEQSPAKSDKDGGARLTSADFDQVQATIAKLSLAKEHPEVKSSNADDVFSESSVGQHQSVQMAGINPAHPAAPTMHGMGRTQISGVDAQNFYSPNACMFVANLPEHVRDTRLEASLTKVCSQYGMVFVKIRRDSRNMPYAFCQFTNEQDARNAMEALQGTMIEGRPVRIEWVKANRSFVVYRVDSGEVNTTTAHQIMSAYGALAKCEALHPQIQEAMGISGGVLVEFSRFDASRDVVGAYRHDLNFRVVPYDLKKKTQKPRVDPDVAWLEKYEIDRRSIFVGNLPVAAEDLEERLASIVRDVGKAVKVQVVRKDATRDQLRPIAFGFVEFLTPDMADAAVKHLTGFVLDGYQLRVERKQSKEPHSIRHIRSVPVFPEDTKKEMVTPGRTKTIRHQRSEYLVRTSKGDLERVKAKPTVSESVPAEPTTPSAPSLPQLNAGSTPFAPASAPHPYPFFGYGPHPYAMPPHVPHGSHPFAMPAPHTPHGAVGGYYGSPFWATPYLQDPNLAMGGYYPTPFQSPLVGMGPQGQGPIPEADQSEGESTTPTKANPRLTQKRLNDA